MTDMIERVAMALVGHDRTMPLSVARGYARAAILAMRDPPEAMLDAGWARDPGYMSDDAWNAAIDEALKP